MILTKEELRYYINEDALQAGYVSLNQIFAPPCRHKFIDRLGYILKFPVKLLQYCFDRDTLQRYMVTLRKAEYYINKTGISKLPFYYYSLKLSRLRFKTGIDLPIDVAGPGLHISHGKIVVSVHAHLGEHCKLMSDITIGTECRYDRFGAPQIGKRVFVGSGARIIGDIKIADDVVIGANSVVVKDILEANTTWAGNPARKISNEGSYHFLNRQ